LIRIEQWVAEGLGDSDAQDHRCRVRRSARKLTFDP
jgi:hypothetical protein